MNRPCSFFIGYEGFGQGSEIISLLERQGFIFDDSNIDYKSRLYHLQPDDFIHSCNCIIVNSSRKFSLIDQEIADEKLFSVNFFGVPDAEELNNLYKFYFSLFEYQHNSVNNYYSKYIKLDDRFGIRYKIYNEEDYKTIEDDFVLISQKENKSKLEIIDTGKLYQQSRIVCPPTGFKYYTTSQILTQGRICTCSLEDEDSKRINSVLKNEEGIYLGDSTIAYCFRDREIQTIEIDYEIDKYRDRYMMDERGISYYDPFVYGRFLEYRMKFSKPES